MHFIFRLSFLGSYVIMLATMFITLFKVSHSYILFEQLNSFLHSFIQYVFLIEQFNILYSPVINFCTDLSATLHHVAQITGKLSHIISRPLIFPRFHQLCYITCCKPTGQSSRDNPRIRQCLSPVYICSKETKPAEKSQLKSFTFSLLLIC